MELKTGTIVKLDTHKARELNNQGWVLRLVDKDQKNPDMRERDYEVLGRWEKNSRV